jgi:hypothetical protein
MPLTIVELVFKLTSVLLDIFAILQIMSLSPILLARSVNLVITVPWVICGLTNVHTKLKV